MKKKEKLEAEHCLVVSTLCNFYLNFFSDSGFKDSFFRVITVKNAVKKSVFYECDIKSKILSYMRHKFLKLLKRFFCGFNIFRH